jgi:NAD(P)-dependent dehydrogenase (short-subunit alcohol dehydrogenase family)
LDDNGVDVDRLGALFDLSGKHAVVTGAASGLGRAIALGVARYGADVLLADLDADGAEQTAERVRALGRAAHVTRVDVADWDQVAEMGTVARAKLGRVDISFNVPGINVRKPALELTAEEFRRVIDVNLVGVFHCAKAIGEIMVEQGGGRMVNIASIHGHGGFPELSAYVAAKHGVVGMTKALALEWAPHNVRVNALAPGYARTSLTAPLVNDTARLERIESIIPMHRFAEPWEMVGAALFLVSDASTYMTGSSLIVDGGWTAM